MGFDIDPYTVLSDVMNQAASGRVYSFTMRRHWSDVTDEASGYLNYVPATGEEDPYPHFTWTGDFTPDPGNEHGTSRITIWTFGGSKTAKAWDHYWFPGGSYLGVGARIDPTCFGTADRLWIMGHEELDYPQDYSGEFPSFSVLELRGGITLSKEFVDTFKNARRLVDAIS
jgi:hypothetical protein